MSSYFNCYANYAANISVPMRTSLSCCRNIAQLLPVYAENEVILDADIELGKNDAEDGTRQALHPKDLFGTGCREVPTTDTSTVCSVTSTHIISMNVPLALRDSCVSGVHETYPHSFHHIDGRPSDVYLVNKNQSSSQTTSLIPPASSYRHSMFLAAGINGGFVVYEITERGAYDLIVQYQSNLIPNLVPNHLMHMISDQVTDSMRQLMTFEVLPTASLNNTRKHLCDSDLIAASGVKGVDTFSTMKSLVDRMLAASLSVPSTGNLLLQDSVSYKSPVISGIHHFSSFTSSHTVFKPDASTENQQYSPLLAFVTKLEEGMLRQKSEGDISTIYTVPEDMMQKRLLQLILLPSLCGHVAKITHQSSNETAMLRDTVPAHRNIRSGVENESMWFLNRCAAELQQKYAFEGTTVPTQRPTRFLDVAIVDETVDTSNPIFLKLPNLNSLLKKNATHKAASNDDFDPMPIQQSETDMSSIKKDENLKNNGESPTESTIHYSNLIGGDESISRGYRNPTHAITLVLLTDSFLHYGCSDALEKESKREFSDDDMNIQNTKHAPKSSGIMEYHQRVMVVRCSHVMAAPNVKMSLKGIMDFCKQEMCAEWAEAMTNSVNERSSSSEHCSSVCDPRLVPFCKYPPYLRRYVDTEVMKKGDLHANLVDRIMRKQLDTDFTSTFSKSVGAYTLNESNLRRRYESIILQILNEGAMVYEVEREFTFKTWPLHTSLHIATPKISSDRSDRGNDPALLPYVTPTTSAANSHQPFPSPQDTPRPECFLTSLKVTPRTVREVHAVLTIGDPGSSAQVQVVTANARRPQVVSGGTIVISGTSFHNSRVNNAMVGDVLMVLKPVEMIPSNQCTGTFSYSHLNGLALTDVIRSEDIRAVNLKNKSNEMTNSGISLINSIDFSDVNNHCAGIRFRISNSSIFAISGRWLALQGYSSALPHTSLHNHDHILPSHSEDIDDNYYDGNAGTTAHATSDSVPYSDSFIISSTYPLIRSFYTSGDRMRLYSSADCQYASCSAKKQVFSLLPPTTAYNDRVPTSESGFVDSCCKIGKKEGGRWMNMLYSASNSGKDKSGNTDEAHGKVLLYSLEYNGPLHSAEHFNEFSVDRWEMKNMTVGTNENGNYHNTMISSSVFASFTAHNHAIRQMTFDNSGTLLATVSLLGTEAKVFQITVEQRCRRHYRSQSNEPHSRSTYVERVGVVTLLHRLIRGTTSADVTCVIFSPLSTVVALSTGNGSVHFYSLNQDRSNTERKESGVSNRVSNWFEEDQNRALVVRGQPAFDHHPNEIHPICRARSGYWGTPHLMVCFRRLSVRCRPSCTTIQQSISTLKKAKEATVIQKGQSLADHKVNVVCDELHDVVLWAPQSATVHYLQLATLISKGADMTKIDADGRIDTKNYLPTQIKSLYSRVLYPQNKSGSLPQKCRLDLSLPFFMSPIAPVQRSTEIGSYISPLPVTQGVLLPRIEGIIPIELQPQTQTHNRTNSLQHSTFESGTNVDDGASVTSTSISISPRAPFAPTVTVSPDLEECALSLRYLRNYWASAAGPSLYDRNEEIAAKAIQLNRIIPSSAEKIVSEGPPQMMSHFVEPLYAIRVASEKNVTVPNNNNSVGYTDGNNDCELADASKTDFMNTIQSVNDNDHDDVLNNVEEDNDDLSTFWHQHTVTVSDGGLFERYNLGGYKPPSIVTENDIYGDELFL